MISSVQFRSLLRHLSAEVERDFSSNYGASEPTWGGVLDICARSLKVPDIDLERWRTETNSWKLAAAPSKQADSLPGFSIKSFLLFLPFVVPDLERGKSDSWSPIHGPIKELKESTKKGLTAIARVFTSPIAKIRENEMTWHVAIRDYECTVYTWQVVLLALVVLGVAWLLRQPGHGETALGGLSKKPSGPDHYPATDARTLLIIVGVSQGATRKNLGGQRLNTEIVTFLGQNAEWLWYGASDQEPPLTVLSPASAKDSTAMYWLRIRTNQRIEALEKNRTLPALKDALNQMADGGAKVEGTGGPVPLSVFTNFTRL